MVVHYKIIGNTTLCIDSTMIKNKIIVSFKRNPLCPKSIYLDKLTHYHPDSSLDLTKADYIIGNPITMRIIYEQYIMKQRKSKLKKIYDSC